MIFAAVAANADPIKDRLDSLEKTVQSMQGDTVSRNEKMAAALAAIETLKQEYQAMQGTIETNNYIINEQKEENLRLRLDLSDRLAAIEERLAIYDDQITKAVAKVLPQAANEMENYQKALDLVQKSDFLNAVASFRSFVKAYSKSDFADNAQFWIAECYFALKDYQKAIKEYQSVVEKYPRSDKIPNAILQQGVSFSELKMTDEAKMFLNKVIKDYPGSDNAVKAREILSKMEQKAAGEPKDGIPLAPGLVGQ